MPDVRSIGFGPRPAPVPGGQTQPPPAGSMSQKWGAGGINQGGPGTGAANGVVNVGNMMAPYFATNPFKKFGANMNLGNFNTNVPEWVRNNRAMQDINRKNRQNQGGAGQMGQKYNGPGASNPLYNDNGPDNGGGGGNNY